MCITQLGHNLTQSFEMTPGFKPFTILHKLVTLTQHAKKVVSDSPGQVDFAIGLVNSVFNMPDRQVKFFEEFD